MAGRVFVHPGPPKTGTTFIQTLLYANAEALRRHGVAVVGSQAQHFNVANELLQTRSRRGKAVPEGAWERVREEVRGFDGDALLSCERYSLLQTQQIRRLVQDLEAGHGREVHALLTLRDLAAVLPARWQESLKNGDSHTWADFCEKVAANPRYLRRMTRADASVRLWTDVLHADRVHVVTVPPSSAPRTLLLERFCAVLGVGLDALDTLEAPRANASLDLVGAEVVRRLNASEAVSLTPHQHHSEVKAFLAARVLNRSRRGERPRLTPSAYDAARRETARVVERIRATGCPVTGDLADLNSAAAPDPDAGAQQIDADAVVEAAVEALGALAERSSRRGRRLAALRPGARDPEDGARPRRLARVKALLGR
ncbi:MAG TPA: hypothetical protein VFG88_10255 [Nocardioidaceae bacterium]|nr:hypothetical protein [Nocardioidaceae bacterium]